MQITGAKSYCEVIVHFQNSEGRRPEQHSLHSLLLDHGQEFEAAPRPENVPKKPFGLCFKNAFELALSDESLTYCEGYAVSTQSIPCLHGWCIDEDGKVVDPTWNQTEDCDYFGIPIRREVVAMMLMHTEVWGILGNLWVHEDVEESIDILFGDLVKV